MREAFRARRHLPPSPPSGAERVRVRWGISGLGTTHLTLPLRGPLPLRPEGQERGLLMEAA